MLGGFSKFVHSIRIDFLGKNKLSGPVKKAQADLTKLKRSFDSVRAAGRKAMMIGLLMAAPLLIGAKAFGDFEESALKFETVVQSTMGGVAQSLDYARGSARAFARAHTQSAKDFMDTSYMMASAGLKDVAAIAATETAMKVSTATMGDHVSAANMLAVIYNNMGDKLKLPADEMQRLGDIVTATQQTFQFEDLGAVTEGFKYAAASALEMQWPLEELMTTIGQLNNVGLQGSMAGTALQQALAKMIPASKKLGFQIARDTKGNFQYIETLKNISKTLGPVTEWTDKTRESIQKAFGLRAKRAITTLLPHIQSMERNLKKVSESGGLTERTVEIMESGFNPQLKIMKNNLSDIAISIGDIGFSGMLKEMNSFLKSLGEFLEAHPAFTKFISILGLVVSSVVILTGMFMWLFGVIGGAVIKFKVLMLTSATAAKIFSGLSAVFSRLSTALFAFFRGPVFWVIFGVMALVSNFKKLYQYSETFRGMISRLGNYLLGVFEPILYDIGAAFGWLSAIWEKYGVSLRGFTDKYLPGLTMAFLVIGFVLKTVVVSALGLLSKAWSAYWGGMAKLIHWVWHGITRRIASGSGTIIKIIKAISSVISFVGKAFDFFASNISTNFANAVKDITYLVDSLINGFKSGFSAIGGFFTDLKKKFLDGGIGLVTAFADGIRQGWGKLKGGIIALFKKMLPYLTGSDAKIGPLSNITGSGAGFVQAFSSGMRAESPELVDAARSTFAKIAPAPQGMQSGGPAPARGGGEIRVVFEDGSIRITSETMEMGTDRLEEKLIRIFQKIKQEYGGVSIEPA